jgi:hypothetical protein
MLLEPCFFVDGYATIEMTQSLHLKKGSQKRWCLKKNVRNIQRIINNLLLEQQEH